MESKSRSILFLFLFCFSIWVQALWGAIEPKRICDDKKLSQLKDFFCYICLLPFRFGLVLFLFVCFFLVLRRIIKTWSILQTFRSFSARFFFKLSKWRVTLLPVFWRVYVNDTHDQCGSKSEYVTWKQYALITKYRRYEAASLIQNRFATLN